MTFQPPEMFPPDEFMKCMQGLLLNLQLRTRAQLVGLLGCHTGQTTEDREATTPEGQLADRALKVVDRLLKTMNRKP